MANTNTNAKISTGDILCGDINVPVEKTVFYQVLRLTPSGKSAVIRQIQTKSLERNPYAMSGRMVPLANQFAFKKTETKRIKQNNALGEYVTIGNSNNVLAKWDGRPKTFNYENED